MKALFVKYEDDRIAFYPSAKKAAEAWSCSSQAVLNMVKKCENARPKDVYPLRNSYIANELGIIAIVAIDNIDDVNKYDNPELFRWIKND